MIQGGLHLSSFLRPMSVWIEASGFPGNSAFLVANLPLSERWWLQQLDSQRSQWGCHCKWPSWAVFLVKSVAQSCLSYAFECAQIECLTKCTPAELGRAWSSGRLNFSEVEAWKAFLKASKYTANKQFTLTNFAVGSGRVEIFFSVVCGNPEITSETVTRKTIEGADRTTSHTATSIAINWSHTGRLTHFKMLLSSC